MSRRWIDQTRTRDTHPDVRGDCTRAAIASLFGLPLDAVPDFDADDPVAFYESIEAFFLSLGYEMVRLDGDVALDALHLANGPAARGVPHTVVRRGTEIVHDPHPSRAGLLSVEFVVVPVPLDPSRLLPAQAYRDRLQAIMEWVDLAHSAAHEFADHGLGLLRGPVFDEARAALDAAPSADRGEAGDANREVIAISGHLGSGKEALSRALAARLGAERISFSIEVRRAVAEAGADVTSLDKLQTIGQAIVVNDCSGLVDRTLAQATGSTAVPLVVCGLRHVEVWCELRRRFPRIRLVHVDTPESVRETRLMEREGLERRVVARLDNAMSEVQSERILPQYASVRVNGTLPVDLRAGYVMTFLGLAPTPRQEPTP